MVEAGLIIGKKRSVSWLRRTPITKLPDSVVDFIERGLQAISGFAHFGPSSWYVLTKPGEYSKPDYKTIDASLVKPKANKKLNKTEITKLSKSNKKAKYIDLRYPKPRK